MTPLLANSPVGLASIGCVINSGAKPDTCATIGLGTAAVTSPAPARSAAIDAIAGAPDFPTDPPITSTCPNFPLFESAAARLLHQRVRTTRPTQPLLRNNRLVR